MNYFQQIIQESRAVTGHVPDHGGNTGSMPGFTVGDTIQSLSNKSPLSTYGDNTNFMKSQSPDVELDVSWSGERQGGEGPGFVPVGESLEITVEEAGQTVSDNLRFSPIQAGVEAKDDMSKEDRQEDNHRFEIFESHRAGRIESQGKPESEEMSESKGPGWQQPAVPVSLFDDSETGTENGADPTPLSFYDSLYGGHYSTADQVVSTTGSGRDPEKDLTHSDSADNPLENQEAAPDNLGRYSVISDTEFPQDQGPLEPETVNNPPPRLPEANPLDLGRAIKGQSTGNPSGPSPSGGVQVDHTFQALPSARDDGFQKDIPEPGASSKAGTISDRAPDTGETRGQELRSDSRDGSPRSGKKQTIEPPIALNIPRQSASALLDSRLSKGFKTTDVKESMDMGRSKGSEATAKALPFSVDTDTDPARKTALGPLTAQTISGTVKYHPADNPALPVGQMFDRRDGWGTSQKPDQPAVHIGHIDVIVEAPKAPAVNPIQAVPAPDPSSRMYLRRL